MKTAKSSKHHVLAVFVENKAGVLNRISSLLRRRRFNIESISAGHTKSDKISQITVLLDPKKTNIDQAVRQINKIIEVIKIVELPGEKALTRELALVKLKTNAKNLKLQKILKTHQASIIDAGKTLTTVQICQSPFEIDALISALKPYKIQELVRTGLTAISLND